MSSVENILKINNIPFDKRLNKKIASLYMTPNAVIISHSFIAINRGGGISKLADRINSIDMFNIYLHIDKMDSITDMPYQRFIDDISRKINIERLTIFFDVNEIVNIPHIFDYSFGIMHCGALWTLVMNNMHDVIGGRNIIIPSMVYGRAIAIMDDTELEMLASYNIIISDDSYQNLVYIIQDTHNNKEPYTMVIKFIPLEGGQRSAIRIVENITSQCELCMKIIYVDKPHSC